MIGSCHYGMRFTAGRGVKLRRLGHGVPWVLESEGCEGCEDEGTMTLHVYQVQEKKDNKECVYCVCGMCG